MTRTTHAEKTSTSTTDHAVVLSCDSHVGPLLDEQLRPHCPSKYLDAFDDFVAAHRAAQEKEATDAPAPSSSGNPDEEEDFDWRDVFDPLADPNLRTAGHHDVETRLRDMDRDGVAAEVIYQFSTNGEVMPFFENNGPPNAPLDLELGAVGMHLYNEWLADFCAAAPDRLIGLAYVPTWDLDAAVREVEWAREAGLRAVNFPSIGRKYNLPYNHPDWDRFWGACASLGMSLNTHANGPPMTDYMSGPGGFDILYLEAGGWLSRRAVWWLIYGQVFDRHPDLKLVLTEQHEGWFVPTMRLLDSASSMGARLGLPQAPLKMKPGDYLRTNVFVGASMMSSRQAMEASQEGYADRVIWGRDYPHREGTYVYDERGVTSITRLSLRHTFARVPTDDARLMAGANGVALYGLDAQKLQAIATSIAAPTSDELMTPLDTLPEVPLSSCAFTGQISMLPPEPRESLATR